MLNRPAAEHAELQDLSADLELKAARRKWNPALHPRDSKGRFIETGGTVRLWGGKLARVVRALPNDRILVQDQTGPNDFSGRRHTTSAKWVSMVARPDGSAPTVDEDKVVAEDERRKKDPVRGNGVALDDDGDPSTPNDPHDNDDQGRPIGGDDGDGPGDDDDEDEPADGNHPLNTAALPNRRHATGSRFKDTATVRQHFTQLADRPGQKPNMVRFLRSVAGDDDLQTNRSGRLAILRDDATGRWYLTATGTGQRMDGAGDFATAREAARFADHLDSNVRADGEDGAPFDFSDPDLDQAAREWNSSNGENVQAAIVRARADFDTAPTAATPKARSTDSSSGTGGAQRFATLDAVRAHWTAGPDAVREGDDSERSRSVQAKNGEIAARKLTRAQLSPAGHFVLVRRGNQWDLHHAGTSLRVAHGFKTKPQAMQAARDLEAVSDDNGQPLDWSAPGSFNANTTGAGKTARAKAQAEADASARPNQAAPSGNAKEQQRLEELRSRPSAADLADEQLRNEYDELIAADFRDIGPEAQALLESRLEDVKRERRARDKHALTARPDVAELLPSELRAERRELERARTSYESDEVAEARRQRIAAIDAEEERRKNTPPLTAPSASNEPDEPLQEAWDKPELFVTLTMPEAMHTYLNEEGTAPLEDPDTRKALREAARGRGGTVKVTAPLAVHETLLQYAAVLAGGDRVDAEPNEIRAYANYAKRITDAAEELQNRPAGSSDTVDVPNVSGDSDDTGTVTLSPDEVSAQLDPVRPEGSKAPSAMTDPEISAEMVALVEREMANGGLSGVDRTRLQVLEAEEARRAGRAPKRDEAKPKPQPDEAGGLFEVDGPAAPQRQAADFANPDDRPADAFGTPDMFAAAEGRDTSNLREPQMRAPMDMQAGDRFVDATGRTHTIAKAPVRTGRGRVLVTSDDGREHLLAPDTTLRVLYPDETAPEPDAANTPEADAPATAEGTPPPDVPDAGASNGDASEPSAGPDDADAPATTEPSAIPDRVSIDHTGTGTVVRFPTPDGRVSDEEFAVLRRLGFKRSRSQRMFYLPSNWTLSNRDGRVGRLKEWLDGRSVAYEATQDNDVKPELSPEQLQQLEDRYFAPDGTWAVTDFRPGDEVWIRGAWDTVDSIGPKNVRLQSRGSTPYDSILARRRGGEIRTMLDAPSDDGTPRPGVTDPTTMRDEVIQEELGRLRGATLPAGNEPAARTVRRQVTARISALTTAQSERDYARRRAERDRRDQADLVRSPQRLAAKKAEQVQGRDGAPIGVVYQEKKGKWRFIDRDGRTPTSESFKTRATAIAALNKVTDARNQRAGEGWKHSVWDDVQPGDTIRTPQLGRSETGRGRIVTGWSEPFEVSEIRRGDLGEVSVTGRRGDEDVTLQMNRADATFGASKPGTVPDREPSDAGGGIPWTRMGPEDFGRDDAPAPTADPSAPRPADEYGTPDLIDSATPTTGDPAPPSNSQPNSDTVDEVPTATAPPAPIRDTSPADMADEDIDAEFEELQAWQNRHVSQTGEGPHVQGPVMLALSPVGNRRQLLLDEQRHRKAIRQAKERIEERKRVRAAALARAEIGKRNADGSYSVAIDGQSEAGTVRQLGRRWKYTHAEGSESGLEYGSRAEAVAGLVGIHDVRRQDTDDAARRDQASRETPDGWVFGDRDDVAENDVIRLPRTENLRGEQVFAGWGNPVRVTDVERRADGTTSVSYRNVDGSHTWGSRLVLRGPEDTFAWAEDRTRPEPTPEWHHELRLRMADMGDDIATLNRLEGFEEPERIQRLAALIRRVEEHKSEDLRGDLEQILDETAWLEGQFTNPDLPWETRNRKSWSTAARMKAERALEEFQDKDYGLSAAPSQNSAPNLPGSPDTEAAAGDDAAAAWAQAAARYDAVQALGLEGLDLDESWAKALQEAADDPTGEHGAHFLQFAQDRAWQWAYRLENENDPGNDEAIAALQAFAVAADHARVRRIMKPRPGERFTTLRELKPGDAVRLQYGGDGYALVGPPPPEDHPWPLPRHRVWTNYQHLDGSSIRPFMAEPADNLVLLSEDTEAIARATEDYNRRKGENEADLARLRSDLAAQQAARDAEEPEAEGVLVAPEELHTGDLVNVTGRDSRGADRSASGHLLAEPLQVTRTVSGEREQGWRLHVGEEGEEANLRNLVTVGLSDRVDRLSGKADAEQDDPDRTNGDDRSARMAGLLGEASNAIGGDSLPEISELRDRVDGADDKDDPDSELRDVANRLDDLADQYALAGPQGEHAADRFRRAARIGRGEQDSESDSADAVNGDDSSVAQGEGTPNGDGEQQDDTASGDEESRPQRRSGDTNRRAAEPDSVPEGGSGGTAEPSRNGGGSSGRADSSDDEQNGAGGEDDEEQRRRRRRNRGRGTGGGGLGGPGGGGLGGPRLPHLNLPDLDNDDNDRTRRHADADSLRRAWRAEEGLDPAEDTPERRALLAQAAEREGLALSPNGGLVTWPEPQDDGSALWRFAQSRNGTNLPGITLNADGPEMAQELAGRFEEITDGNGDAFDWHQAWGPSRVAQWRDGEGRNLPRALRAVQDDYEQERNGAFALPEDLTGLDDTELEAAFRRGLGPEDELRMMAEMDRRDGLVDERIRAAVPDTPPADAAEAERRGRAMDEAFGFGGADVTRPAPAGPGSLRREFDALDEERFQAALAATGGRLFNPESEDSGVDPRDLFSGRKVKTARAQELASDELRSWFDANGGRLTYSTYSARERDRVLRAEFTDIDEARYLAAVAATNGYFFRRQHEGSSIDERELFSGGSMSQFDRWKDVASEELQEWFDANGGRLTFNQFKQSRRDDDRTARDLFEEEQRRAAEAGGPESTVSSTADDVAPAPARDGFTADDVAPAPARDGFTADDVAPAPPGHVESAEDATSRFGGHDKMREFADQAELRPIGDGETVWLDGRRIGLISNVYRSNPNKQPVWNATPFFGLDNDRISRSQSRDTAIANLVVRALRDGPVDPANPSEDVWDTVTAHLASRTGGLPELPRNDPGARARHDRLAALLEAFRSHRSPSGDLRDDLAQARDDFAWLHDLLPKTGQTERDRRGLDNRSFWAGSLLDGLGAPESDDQRPHANSPESDRQRPRGDDKPLSESDAPSPAVPTPDEPVNTPEDTARPPEDTVRPSAVPGPETAPEPIGGQPAHWARVEDLSPGDMVRMDGTKKSGRPTQRAGYVYTGPVRVEVTRGGRTMEMWRTRVTENPDGTGSALNVYTSINATAARAEAPDDVVPGSPASGAQASLHTGDLPDVIPADRDGSGLFPGSTVSGSDDREGTITGATSTTVSVHWSGGRDEDSVSPTSLTVTDGQRPDGWTADGQRVTPQHIVSDSDGALLGPVDDVDGDNVSITTTSGSTITRSAGDLHVTREVRDDAPAATPVTGIDDTAAADLREGDVVVLDLDGTPTTVVISETPSRDGDRVTLTYADTTSGEMGELDVDASMALPRLHGPDGNAPELGPDDAPDTSDDLVVHEPPRRIDPVTDPTIDPNLTMGDLDVIDDHATGPDDDPDAHQAAVRITDDLPVTPTQAASLAAQLREAADPATPEGRAALRAADHLDEAAGRTPPAGLDRPRPATVAQLAEGDLVALPSERSGGGQVRAYRVVDATDAPGGVRSLHLTDENGRRDSRIEHGALPVWLLPEPEPTPVTPPDPDDTTTPEAPSTPSAPNTPTLPVAQVRPGDLRAGDVIDAPVSRSGYQFNAHQRLTIISAPQRNGWWMQLTGVDDNGNVHDFGLHSGRAVNVYDRNRPTPALPPLGRPRDPNPRPQNTTNALLRDNVRSLRVRIRGEALAGTVPAGDIHALREAIAARVAPEALQEIRQTARRDGLAALDASGLTGQGLVDARQELRTASDGAHEEEVRAILRTINDLEPIPGESDEDLAARARDLLRLIPQPAGPRTRGDGDGDAGVTRTVSGHVGAAVNTLMQQLQAAGVDPGDAERIARTLLRQLDGSRQATARRIARRVTAASPAAGRQPGLLARIVALLINLAKRFAELVRVGAQKIAEKYRSARERMQRLRAFLRRLARRVRQWPESRRLARLHRAVNLPDADGESLAARISHWSGLMPDRGRFGQSQRRVTWWRPATWGQLASGRLPDRTDRIQWTPDTAADGGPGLTALRHMAALRAAGSDVDQDVTRRLSAALGDDFGDDPHAALQHADDHVAASEQRLVNLQGARSGATIPDDPDLEIELTTARAELLAARRDYADMRARYAAAVPDAVAAALADIRDMGPEGNAALVFGPDTDPDAERALRGVQRLIPRTWLNTPAARRLTAVDGNQGRYEPDGQRITVADLADEGMGTAGHALAQHLARHIGDLDAAQRVFWFTSTHTGRPGARRMRRSPLSRLLSRQQTQRDTGDTLARSLQAMFNGDWYLDDDLRAFLLGLMATR
ncbi:hypothetical protein ABZ804_22140 [Streptomyces sp. NPDC047726]|uniref:hypothetical protein n=1 Tax=Streptomyces sp. NPDC047726 TaxID=3156651 RepID=UPI0033F0F606